MAIAPIANGETGLSTRGKLNSVIDDTEQLRFLAPTSRLLWGDITSPDSGQTSLGAVGIMTHTYSFNALSALPLTISCGIRTVASSSSFSVIGFGVDSSNYFTIKWSRAEIIVEEVVGGAPPNTILSATFQVNFTDSRREVWEFRFSPTSSRQGVINTNRPNLAGTQAYLGILPLLSAPFNDVRNLTFVGGADIENALISCINASIT